MNKTKIEWCDRTYNPVTGCLHGCRYCFARDFAQRFGGADLGDTCSYGAGKDWHRGDDPFAEPFDHTKLFVVDKPLMVTRKNGKKVKAPYPFGFEPTFHRYRLDEPQRVKNPQNVFVVDMGDLFGSWVPTSWIIDVIDSCLAAPQHNYLFLTKNPARYADLTKLAILPQTDNFWYGTTVTVAAELQTRSIQMAEAFFDGEYKWFVSIEPLSELIDYGSAEYVSMFDWVIVGAESGNRKGKIIPDKDWISVLSAACSAYDVPLFMKDSVIPIVGEQAMLRQWPNELRKVAT